MRRSRWILAGAIAIGLAGGGAGIALASGGPNDDDGTERPITGDALGKAEAAALAHTGEGRVTGTEVGDEEGYYEVEVTLPDGGQVDVRLDETFTVFGDEHDGQGEDRSDAGDR